jgi:hypothetical protein
MTLSMCESLSDTTLLHNPSSGGARPDGPTKARGREKTNGQRPKGGCPFGRLPTADRDDLHLMNADAARVGAELRIQH